MKFALNTYAQYMSGDAVRIEVYPNSDFAAKLAAEYKQRGFDVVPLYSILPSDMQGIPSPDQVIRLISNYSKSHANGVVFVGVDAYLTLLSGPDQNDFFIGVRSFLDAHSGNARVLVGRNCFSSRPFHNPRYSETLQLVEFASDELWDVEEGVHISLIPQKWVGGNGNVRHISTAIQALGDYTPDGSFSFSVADAFLPSGNYGSVSVMREARAVLSHLYNLHADISESCAAALLSACAEADRAPIDLLLERLGGLPSMTVRVLPQRLHELAEDPLWEAYVWLIKSRISQNSYLYQVLKQLKKPADISRCYIVDTAISVLSTPRAKDYAQERADALRGNASLETLISQFANETEDNVSAIPFLNCGTSAELRSLIRRVQRLDFAAGLPEVYKDIEPIIGYYLAPYYDYGNASLSDYFHQLRQFRLQNTVSKAFVNQAFHESVPYSIAKRDDIIARYDDGNTVLLCIDGMGAEYYPLLLNLAEKNGLHIETSYLVQANLPTSTDFNKIKWNDTKRLPEIKQIDNISHTGASPHEVCTYDENLAEVFNSFQRRIFPRITEALNKHQRVLVTADHGSSYLAVTAHKNGMSKTLTDDVWGGKVDDWRFTSLESEIEAPSGTEYTYTAERQTHYYVVKGYNRLPKKGGKPYGLHGGATLEERLVPFVVFTNEKAERVDQPAAEPEFIEDDAFDIL